MPKARIRKGDQVVVISGKDRDLTKACRVLQVYPSRQRVLVEGVNIIKRHTRKSQEHPQGH